MLDSSEVIRIERGGLRLAEYLERLPGQECLAAITISEIAVGALLADTPVRRNARLQFLDDLLAVAPVLPFGESEARVHARLRVELRNAGESIGAADLIIAATALSNGHSVLTQNVREFQRVAGLGVLSLNDLPPDAPG